MFFVWCASILANAYSTHIKQKFEVVKMKLVKIYCCGRYFFSKKSKSYYIRRRWLNSIIVHLKNSNLVNTWTGKLKISKYEVFKILEEK